MTRALPLADVRVIECSMLGPGSITTALADMGAEIIKVEPPSGDYIREMTWPIVEGTSLMHLHISRGKKSITIDLRSEEGKAVFLDLIRSADVVVEAMRPGGLAKRGLGYEELKAINPKIVWCTISGYGMTGPYKNLPSHGIAYDTWSGAVKPAVDEEGFVLIPEHASIGIHVGPLFGALGILAGVIRARSTGEGCQLEIAQSDASAAIDWLRSETERAYLRPESEVTGNKSDNFERRPAGTAGMAGGVRYAMYESSDGYVMLMASEQEFWRNFCAGVGRMDLFEKWPGSKYADHARWNRELQAELRDIFKTRTSAEWLAFGTEFNTTMAPVNTPKTIADDPQFQDRLPWLPEAVLGTDQVPSPIKFLGEDFPIPTKAPSNGEHTKEILGSVLGYTEGQIAALLASGAVAARS